MIPLPRWNPHIFVLITLAVYAPTHAFTMVCLPNLRIWPGLVRTPGRDPRQFTSLLIHHFLLLVANHLNRSFIHSDTNLNAVQHPPRTQCFSCHRFCSFVDIYNECFVVQQLYITVKDNTCCKNKERFITKGTEACHSSFDISSHHHLLCLNAQHPGTVTLPLRLARNTPDVIGSVTVP